MSVLNLSLIHISAVKQFQARNDLVVDGYLGPSTRVALNSAEAQANGLMPVSYTHLSGGAC